MIEFDEKVIAVFFLGTAPRYGVDWLCAIRELEPDTRYEITFRFRYQVDGKIFDSEDKKSWFSGTSNCTRAFVIAAARETAQIMRAACQDPESYWELVNDGDYAAFMAKFRKAPFVFERQL